MPELPKKILVIRFSSIGDIVLTSPVLRCLKHQIPETELHFLTKKQNAGILTANPYIDKLHLFEDDLQATIQSLKKEQFDFILDLHSSIRSGLLRKRLGVRSRVFNKMNVQKWLFTTFKINHLKNQHIVDRYLKPLEEFGVKNDENGLDFFIGDDQQVNLAAELPELNQVFVAYGIGALHATKRLPTDKIIELLRRIEPQVVLLGGPADKARGEEIAAAINGQLAPSSKDINKVINLCGKYKLQQSASILEQAEWVICHDSALMHIAAALDKKIALLWGNTHPDFGMYPYLKSPSSIAHNFQVEELSCRPCSKIGHESCPKKHFNCMQQQDLQAIADMVNNAS